MPPKYFSITAKQLRSFEHELQQAGYSHREDGGNDIFWEKPGAPTHRFRAHPFAMIALDLGER